MSSVGGTATDAPTTARSMWSFAVPRNRGRGRRDEPEQLFAFGYAACFESALGVVARRETAAQLVRDAHQVCPCSNATRGNIDVDLLLVGSPV